jgi:hypothetical protein
MKVIVGGQEYEIDGSAFEPAPTWRLLKFHGKSFTKKQFDGLPNEEKRELTKHAQAYLNQVRNYQAGVAAANYDRTLRGEPTLLETASVVAPPSSASSERAQNFGFAEAGAGTFADGGSFYGGVDLAPSAGTTPVTATAGINLEARASSAVGGSAIPRIEEPLKPKPRRRAASPNSKRQRTTTNVGRAVLANNSEIILNAEVLISLIHAEIIRIQHDRVNDPEPIERLKAIAGELERVQQIVFDFKSRKVDEKELPKVFEGLRTALAYVFEQKGRQYISQVAAVGFVAGATVLFARAGMPGAEAGFFAAAICARDEVSKLLKAAKGVLRINVKS